MSRLASRTAALALLCSCVALTHCTPKASSESVSSSGNANGADAGPSEADDDGRDQESPDEDGEDLPRDGDSRPGDGSESPEDGTDGPRDAGADGDADATVDEGWTSVGDGDPNPDPGDGGTPGACRSLAPNVNSGGFGTTGSVCFVLSAAPPTAWAVYFGDGRTITINGSVVRPGELPFPGSAPYTVLFSAGNLDYTAWAYW